MSNPDAPNGQDPHSLRQVFQLLEDAQREETRLAAELREHCDFEAARHHDYAVELLGRLRYAARQQPNGVLNKPEAHK